MCQWRETGAEFLYAHDTQADTIFFYTRQKKPDSLAEGFQNRNCILVFAGWPVTGAAQPDQLGKKLLAFEKRNMPEDGMIKGAAVWILEEDSPAENWSVLFLKPAESAGCFLLAGTVSFGMGVYSLGLSGGDTVSVEHSAEEGEKVVFSASGKGYAAEFICDGGVFSRMQDCCLLMEGGSAGCFAFSLSGAVTLSGLNAGLCYSMRREKALHGGMVESFFDTALDPEKEIDSLEGRLDVLRLFDTERSFFLLPEGEWETAFPVWLSPQNLLLRAARESMKLVFAKRRTQANAPAYQYYLTFDGYFIIEGDGGSLLLGMNGQEYVNFRKGSRLYFVSGQRGYFSPEETEDGKHAVTGDTAYAALEEGTYYSQAAECSFYTTDAAEGIQDYAQIPFCLLHKERCFPLFPPGQKILDQRWLSGRRNELLSGEENESRILDGSMTVLSQKGLYGMVSPGRDRFEWLEFCDKFRFGGVSGKLKQALLASYAFLVIADAEEFLRYASVLPEDPPFSIGGWTFCFDPGQWEENGTFLVLKYTSHKSVRELAKTPDEWSYPAAGNDLKKNAHSVLAAFLDRLSRKKDDAEFAKLLEIVDEPKWCGALACSVPVAGSSLPDHLKFLIRIREGRKLTAHHLIFDKRMMDSDGNLSAGEVSGVLFYEDPEHPVLAEGSSFYYKLDLLKVVFAQSRVTGFFCRISLTIPSFLGMPLYVPDGRYGNYMILTGRMAEDKDAGVSDCFFELEECVEYFTSGAPLQGFRVETVNLVSSAREEKNSFFLSGRIKFAKWEKDILSYGDSEKEENCSLVFSDLLLLEERGNFSIHVGSMKFHHEAGRPRAGSLAKQFPTAFQGFFTGADKKELEQLGYEGIQVDGIRQEELTGSFCAALFRIDLGGMGALSSAGNLGMLLCVAWSAGAVHKEGDGGISVGESPCYIGARLGTAEGSGGLLPIQGIMGMYIDSVELKSSDEGTFYLYLRNFSLKILNYGFPPGNNNIYIFPSPQADGELGWYAAYEAEG